MDQFYAALWTYFAPPLTPGALDHIGKRSGNGAHRLCRGSFRDPDAAALARRDHVHQHPALDGQGKRRPFRGPGRSGLARRRHFVLLRQPAFIGPFAGGILPLPLVVEHESPDRQRTAMPAHRIAIAERVDILSFHRHVWATCRRDRHVRKTCRQEQDTST